MLGVNTKVVNRYSHLEKIEVVEYDWGNNLLKKSLPIRSFTNRLTSNLLIGCEIMLVKSMKPIDRLKKWYSL